MAKKNKKWMIWGLVALVLLLIIGTYIKNKSTPKGVEVTVEKVGLHNIKEIVTASGKIFPENEVKISSDVSGEIVGLYVKEGDTVKAGQLLVKINPDSYIPSVKRGQASVKSSQTQEAVSQTQILNARAQLAQVNAQLTNARQIHTRNEKLYDEGVISKADLEASQASLDGLIANKKVAEAGIKQAEQNATASVYGTQSAKASLQELQTSLDRTSIYAPTDGVISSLNVEKGERVVGTIQMTGTEMMTIANLSSIEVQVEVSENDIVRVSKGDSALIEVDAFYGRKFDGIVTEIANSAISATTASATLNTDQVTNFRVKIRMSVESYKEMIEPGKPFPFRPGMSASVEINTNVVNNVVAVPIMAVTTREDPDQKNKDKKTDLVEVVFLQNTDTARMVRVKTGIQDDEFIQILEGINEGEMLVTGPYSTVSRELKPGSKINIGAKKSSKDKEENKEE